ncbi:glycerophosphodiester phosphodiesterase GDPDL7-like [Vitis riparia]|uniref:glycerophosphodiester phosphodiesterase GDPDL7-like n=1 Tax=Vitis riparia TaxID=96939 RepID=UPI00155A6E5D|nr:glycerophosphodiester phosphodiesterase GDPDL7-like [Vitis riparia]
MIRCLFLFSLLILSTSAQKTSSQTWQTLNGDEPVVIARGGFSGLFPESSQFAHQIALSTSLSNVILYCNLQLTKDSVGICQTDIRLDNSTNIAAVFPKSQKTYTINGENVQGWFALDYTSDQLFNNVTLTQSIYSRPSLFDGTLPLSTVDDAIGIKPPGFWLNVQYDAFYAANKLSVSSYIQKTTRFMGISYISSPEIGFLKNMNKIINKAKTKLIFRFLDADAVEPTTKQPYSSILKDLSSIKSIATGILVPKEYIWPLSKDQYLLTPTSVVADAHKQGLEVYASGFANDMPGSYNYSYDPTAEYLQFVDNSEFSVDGVLTDFPPTASEAIACLAHNKNATRPSKGKILVISHNGASGVYPGSTDLAYQQAVDDGADIIDCSVQMSKDGVAFCLNSADLLGSSNAMTSFMSRSTMVSEIQPKSGIFSFDLTWSEIQTLTPQLTSPLPNSGLARNPANKNQGKFITLSDFLDFAKAKAVSGILIDIENAAYLASKKGLSIIDAVTAALSNATFDKQSTQQVMIQSDDTSVLSKFKNVPAYKRVLSIKEIIGDVPKQTVEEIKKFADAVNLPRSSIVTTNGGFTTTFTTVVDELHAANISAYVSVLRNEYVAIAFDFFSDPLVELATYVGRIGIDGVVTDYPKTADAYLRSPCSDLNAKVAYSILPAEAGALLGLAEPEVLPPAEAPGPPLTVDDVVDPPLPQVSSSNGSTADPAAGPVKAPPSSSGRANAANMGLHLLGILLISLLSAGY